MKMFYAFLALILSTLMLSGCSTCRPCQKKAAETTAVPAAPVAAAPVAPVAVQEPVPATVVEETVEEVAEETVPMTTRKYVNK